MHEETPPVRNDDTPLGSGFLIAIISLAVGWTLGILSTPHGNQSGQDSSKALSGYIEPLQDPRERELIRQLEIGDDLSTQVDLRMLADEVFGPDHRDFSMIYDHFLKSNPNLPADGDRCEILYFDLRTQQYEGVRSYYIFTRDGEVLAICEGESVTI